MPSYAAQGAVRQTPMRRNPGYPAA